MLAATLIVFREVLEAALIVSIVLAATRNVSKRSLWISLGITGGVICASIVAAGTNFLSGLFDGAGQDIVNASILFIAVTLISWHIIWMNNHGRALAKQMREVGADVSSGNKHMSVLAVVVGLAIMREGSEIVLMLQGYWINDAQRVLTLTGAALGLAGGIIAGALIYFGFLALSLRRVFALTNFILVLIAAGMAARAADCLVQAGLVESFGSRLWDTSGIISDHSILGQTLAALTGYIARPSGIELAFYVSTIGIITALVGIIRIRKSTAHVAIIAFTCCLSIAHARANEVISPYVVKGEFELEQQGYLSHDRNQDNSGEKNLIAEIGYSPTDWWRAELEGEFARDPGQGNNIRYGSFNWENTFQVTEPGEYWLDSGLFAEVDFTRQDEANNFVFGYLGAKQFGPVMETFNILLHKDVGTDDTATGLIYSSQTKYMVKPWLEPGFEVYGDTAGRARMADQGFAAGPGLFGKIYTFDGQALKYEVAYLAGATQATPDNAVRWKLEYEWYF